MTTIKECSYSPNHPAILHAPLAGKIHLLQKGAAHDISGHVGRIVQDHLAYKGDAVYNIKLTKTRIEFSIDGESRVLEQKDGRWELSLNKGTPSLLSAVKSAVITEYVTEVLVNIRNAANGSNPATSTEAAAVSTLSSIPTTAAPVNLDATHRQLDALNERIDHILLDQPRSNPDSHALEHSIEALRDVCKILREEIQALRQMSSHSTLLIEHSLKQSHAVLEQAAKNAREKEQTLAEKIAQLEQQNQALQKSESQLADALKSLKAAQQASKDQIESLQRKALSQRASIEQLESDIRKLESKSKSEIADLEAQLQQGAQKAEALNKQLTDITQKLKEASAKEAAVRLELEALKKEQDTYKDKTAYVSKVGDENRQLTTENKDLDSQLKKADSRLKALDKQVQELESSLAGFPAEALAHQQEKSVFAATKKDLEAALEKARAQVDVLQSKNAAEFAAQKEKNATLEALQIQLAEAQKTSLAQIEREEENSSLQKEAQAATAAEIAGLKGKISSLQKQLDLDQTAIKKANLETQQVKKELRALEADKAAAEENFKQVTQRLQDQFVKEKDKVVQQLQASEKANQDRSFEIESLQKQLDALKASMQQNRVNLSKQADETRQNAAKADKRVQEVLSKFNIPTK